jgi:hypothetical protein
MSQTQSVSESADHMMSTHAPSAPRLPDFFIVGQPKSGTTALYQALRQHPEIFMPTAKEPNFFSAEWQSSTAPPEQLEDYLSLFATAKPDQRTGEASVFYLTSPVAARAIADAQPAARVIAILREPASFLRSLHLQFVQSDFEPETSLRNALAREAGRRKGMGMPRTAGNWRRRLFYRDHIRYVEHLRRYYDAFAPQQIMALIYDDLLRDNDSTLRAVLRFLEVDDRAQISLERVNRTVGVRSRHLNHIAFREEGIVWQLATRPAKVLMPAQLRHRVRTAWQRFSYVAPPPPDDRLMMELRRICRPEVEALADFLNRDLVKLWGYDELD